MENERAGALLARERERIERALGARSHQDDSEPTDDLEPSNRAATLWQDEFDDGQVDDLHSQLAAVDRAEARLAAGTYGRSILSGDVIPDERLEVLPTAELTVEEERARGG